MDRHIRIYGLIACALCLNTPVDTTTTAGKRNSVELVDSAVVNEINQKDIHYSSDGTWASYYVTNLTIQNNAIPYQLDKDVRPIWAARNDGNMSVFPFTDGSSINITSIPSRESIVRQASLNRHWQTTNDRHVSVSGYHGHIRSISSTVNLTDVQHTQTSYAVFMLNRDDANSTNNTTNNTAVFQFMGMNVIVAESHLCSGSRDNLSTDPLCYCDIECILFHDCCVDAVPVIFGASDPFTIRKYLKHIRQWYIQSQKLTFETKYLSLMANYGRCISSYFRGLKERRSYMMIGACPAGKVGFLKIQCEYARGRLHSIPAYLNVQATWQIVFRNVYCAMCHGVEPNDIELWSSELVCPNTVNWNGTNSLSKTFLSQCAVNFDKPDETKGKLRRCIPYKDLSHCDEDAHIWNITDDKNVCHLYVAPVRINSTDIYRNVHCAYCSSDLPLSGRLERVESVESITGRFPSGSGGYTPAAGVVPMPDRYGLILLTAKFSFSQGFSFQTPSGNKLHARKHACDDGFRYDVMTYKCKQIVCPFGKVLKNSLCVHDHTMLITSNQKLLPIYGNELDNYAFLRFHIEERNLAINDSEIITILEEFLEEVLRTEENNISLCTYVGNLTNAQKPPYIEFYFDNHYLGHVLQNTKTLYKLISDSDFSLFGVTSVSISNMFSTQPFSCPGNTGSPLFVYSNLTVVVHGDMVYVMYQKERPITVNITRFVLALDKNTNTFFGSTVVLCSFLNCEMDKFEQNEYWIDNGSLVLNSTGLVLPPDRYELRDNRVYVCQDDVAGHTINVEFIYDHIAIILQRVTASLSIASLLLTIAIYFRSASVQTVHGKTLVSLSVSLIIAQTMGLLQSQKEDIACKIVAVVLHLGLLSALGWMSIISYDMMRTFVVRQPVSTNKKANFKRYITYATISWGVPATLVLICLVLDNVQTSMMTRYGADRFCFIANIYVFFVFYITPHIVSLSFNIIAFTITVYSLSSRRTNTNRKKNDKLRYLIIYFKLAIVMGFTWIFAILASTTTWVWLWYISIILAGLQGVFVFLSFALRAHILRAMKLRRATSLRFGISFSLNTAPKDNHRPQGF